MYGHRYNRRCYCGACSLTAKHRLATFGVWYFGILFAAMVGGVILVIVLTILGEIPWR